MGFVFCKACGKQLDGLLELPGHERIPCPRCGSTSRRFEESCEVRIGLSAHFSLLHQREDKAIGFEESRKNGTSIANRGNNGCVSYTLTGASPQGEEDTLPACRILIAALNKAGGNWDQPTKGEGVIDCQAVDRLSKERYLQIQIVRAKIDSIFWKALNLDGKTERKDTIVELAEQLKSAVEAKANDRKIPNVSRRGLVIALDATKLPAHSFDDVVETFRSKWGRWAKELGFDGVWLVGPNESLTWQLDT